MCSAGSLTFLVPAFASGAPRGRFHAARGIVSPPHPRAEPRSTTKMQHPTGRRNGTALRLQGKKFNLISNETFTKLVATGRNCKLEIAQQKQSCLVQDRFVSNRTML